jgi:hypothetical protein
MLLDNQLPKSCVLILERHTCVTIARVEVLMVVVTPDFQLGAHCVRFSRS